MSDRLAAALAELVDAIRAEMEPVDRGVVPERLLSVDEAADLAGIGRSLLYDQIAAGRLRSIKCGRRRLIPAGALDEWTAR